MSEDSPFNGGKRSRSNTFSGISEFESELSSQSFKLNLLPTVKLQRSISVDAPLSKDVSVFKGKYLFFV